MIHCCCRVSEWRFNEIVVGASPRSLPTAGNPRIDLILKRNIAMLF